MPTFQNRQAQCEMYEMPLTKKGFIPLIFTKRFCLQPDLPIENKIWNQGSCLLLNFQCLCKQLKIVWNVCTMMCFLDKRQSYQFPTLSYLTYTYPAYPMKIDVVVSYEENTWQQLSLTFFQQLSCILNNSYLSWKHRRQEMGNNVEGLSKFFESKISLLKCLFVSDFLKNKQSPRK